MDRKRVNHLGASVCLQTAQEPLDKRLLVAALVASSELMYFFDRPATNRTHYMNGLL